MLIGIDYDASYAVDPEGWRAVISLMQARGHKFVCVTGRSNDGLLVKEVLEAIDDFIPIVFAGKEWKKIAAEKSGYKIDVWIDE